MIAGTVLHAGVTSGPVRVLSEPVSFWGAYDPRTGCIVDTHHPQAGLCLSGHILLLPETRGSGGTPGGIAEAIRLGTAPLGVVLITPDINLAIGAAVATKLYGKTCPIVSVVPDAYASLSRLPYLTIAADGTIGP